MFLLDVAEPNVKKAQCVELCEARIRPHVKSDFHDACWFGIQCLKIEGAFTMMSFSHLQIHVCMAQEERFLAELAEQLRLKPLSK